MGRLSLLWAAWIPVHGVWTLSIVEKVTGMQASKRKMHVFISSVGDYGYTQVLKPQPFTLSYDRLYPGTVTIIIPPPNWYIKIVGSMFLSGNIKLSGTKNINILQLGLTLCKIFVVLKRRAYLWVFAV